MRDSVNRWFSVTHAALSVSIRQTDAPRVSFAFVVENVAISRESVTLQEKCFAIGDAFSAIRRDITLLTVLYNGGYMSTGPLRNAMLNLSGAKLSRCSSATIRPAS